MEIKIEKQINLMKNINSEPSALKNLEMQLINFTKNAYKNLF